MSHSLPARSTLQSQANNASHELHIPCRPVLGGSDLLKGVPKNILHKFGVGVCEDLFKDRVEVAIEWSRLDNDAKKFRNPHRFYKEYMRPDYEVLSIPSEVDTSGISTYDRLGRVKGNIATNKSPLYTQSHSQSIHSHAVHQNADRTTSNDSNKFVSDEFKQHNERVHLDRNLEKDVLNNFSPVTPSVATVGKQVLPKKRQPANYAPVSTETKVAQVAQAVSVTQPLSMPKPPPSETSSQQKTVSFEPSERGGVPLRNSLYRTNVRHN